MDLSQARVLVTGGSSGIGYATAKELVERGAKVAICGRREEALERAAGELDVTSVHADVAVERDVVKLVETVKDQLGGYDVLVNNAAWGYFAPLVEQDTQRFNELFATNVTGAMMVARESAKHFIAAGHGNIVNVASTAARSGFAGGSAYAASKFALTALTECWRAELRKHDIRVMQVNPSEVQTGFASAAGYEQKLSERKLHSEDIAHMIVAALEMHDRGFTTEFTIFATNPD